MLQSLGALYDEIKVSDDDFAFFGKLWKGHAFNHQSCAKPLPTKTESHITRGLSHFIEEKCNNDRAKYVLLSLFKAANINVPESLDDPHVVVNIVAEAHAGKRRKIDMLFKWGKPENYAVVEVKFRHIQTNGQLTTYRKFAEQARGEHFLFFLTPHGRNPINLKKKNWNPVTWLSFLRQLENHAYEYSDDDANFAAFRNIIWEKHCE
jgi:hypothetical protein